MEENKISGMEKICPAFKDHNIPVCFFSDDYYVPYLGTAVYSAIKNCAESTNLDILIFENGYSKENREQLQQLGAAKKNISIRFINLLPFLEKLNVNPYKRISINCFAKIFCTDEIFDHYAKIIALDSDLLVLKDLMPLFLSDMKGMAIAAAKDFSLDIMANKGYHADKRLSYMPLKEYFKSLDLDTKDYFNTGVVLYDIKKCQAEDAQQKIIDVNNKYPSMMYAAQDDFNILFKGRWAELDAQWNVQSPYSIVAHCADFPEGYVDLMDHAGILHFLGKSKPWTDTKVWKSELFDEYARETPWKDEYFARRKAFERKNRFSKWLIPKGSKRRELWLKFLFSMRMKMRKEGS